MGCRFRGITALSAELEPSNNCERRERHVCSARPGRLRARDGRMARPWPKKTKWPYVAKSGRRSYVVGFYDHDRRERCRTFPSVRHARAWMDDYITAERRGRPKSAALSLGPRRQGGQRSGGAHDRAGARALSAGQRASQEPRRPRALDLERYESLIGLHMLDKARPRGFGGLAPPRPYAVAFCSLSAVRFNQPQAPAAWREQMLREGVPKATRKQAWRVYPPHSAGPPAQTWWARSAPTGAVSRLNRAATLPLAALRRHRLRARPAPSRAACRPGRSHPRRSRRSAHRCSPAPRGARRSSPNATR